MHQVPQNPDPLLTSTMTHWGTYLATTTITCLRVPKAFQESDPQATFTMPLWAPKDPTLAPISTMTLQIITVLQDPRVFAMVKVVVVCWAMVAKGMVLLVLKVPQDPRLPPTCTMKLQIVRVPQDPRVFAMVMVVVVYWAMVARGMVLLVLKVPQDPRLHPTCTMILQIVRVPQDPRVLTMAMVARGMVLLVLKVPQDPRLHPTCTMILQIVRVPQDPRVLTMVMVVVVCWAMVARSILVLKILVLKKLQGLRIHTRVAILGVLLAMVTKGKVLLTFNILMLNGREVSSARVRELQVPKGPMTLIRRRAIKRG